MIRVDDHIRLKINPVCSSGSQIGCSNDGMTSFWFFSLHSVGYMHCVFSRLNVVDATSSASPYFCHSSVLFFSCDQAALKMVFSSVRLVVSPSVTPFWLCSHHRIIMKFSGFITNDQSKVHAKRQSQRSKVKFTEVTTPLNRFRTVTPVWIHIWWWNDAYSLMLLRRDALLFFKVIRQISRSHGSKNRRIWPRLGVSGH